MRTLVWFRGKDLRISDHEPLRSAISQGECIPVFVIDPYFFSPKRAQELPHRMQFLLEGLEALAKNIEHKGSKLICVSGKSTEVIPKLAKKFEVDRVVAHRWVEPFGQKRDQIITDTMGVPFELFEGETLHPPGRLRTGKGTPFGVFTPFSKKFRSTVKIQDCAGAPKTIPALPPLPAVEEVQIPTLDSLGIETNPNIQMGGEKAAKKRLKHYLEQAASNYHEDRDRMDRPGTSRLSADIKFGTLSIRTIWNAIEKNLPDGDAKYVYSNELLWREFSHSTLWDRPEILKEPFKPKFKDFPWTFNEEFWNAWTEGKTGYPVIDASARQLIQEGFVHNRARMISASFLTKHLMIHYKHGEAHYMRYLTDGDWAQNIAGWQWSAGCGCDAQPYFRVFNPMLQGKKFDPNGDYVRKYLPELARVPTKYIHAPWEAPAHVLEEAQTVLGREYPKPIVDHAAARKHFLALAKSFLKPAEK